MKSLKIIAGILTLVVLTSCTNRFYYSIPKTLNKEYYTRIVIAGPGNCGQMILLNKDGSGISMRGTIPVNENDEFDNFVSIERLTTFKIASDEDLLSINSLVSELAQSKKIKGNPRLDARHLKIYIGNELKLDIYNVYMNKFEQILIKLHSHISYNIDEFCDLK